MRAIRWERIFPVYLTGILPRFHPLFPPLSSLSPPRNEKVELLRPQIDKPAQEGTTNPRRNLERSVRDENKHYERRLTEIRPVSGANIHFEPRFTTPAACSCNEPRRKAYTPPPPLTQFGRLRCARVACATRCRHPCRGLGAGERGTERGREGGRQIVECIGWPGPDKSRARTSRHTRASYDYDCSTAGKKERGQVR